MSDTLLGHVWLVGAGPGDPGWITHAGLEALRNAEVVVYDRLAPAELLSDAPAGALLVNAGKEPTRHAMTQDEINACLVEHGRAGKRVVRLKGGDPYVFGRGGEEAVALRQAGVPCTVIPGITSAIAGLAAAGIPITHRGVAVSFAVVTGHEDPTKPAEQANWHRLATAVDTLVVLMGVGRLDAITQALIAGGRDPASPAALIQEAATTRQRVVTAPLSAIAAAAREHDVQSPALFVVGDVVALRDQLDPAGLGPLAGKRVLVTRTRAQASTLVEQLKLQGARPLVLPAIEVQHRAEPAEVARAALSLRAGDVEWVAFTSAIAVRVFLDLLADSQTDARAFAGAKICALGDATAAALAERGLIADLVPTEATGAAAASAMIDAFEATGLTAARVLLPRAEGADPALPTALTAAGATVTEVTLYLSGPPSSVPDTLLNEVRAGVDVATFTSSSTVRNLATLLGDLSSLQGATIACIGPTTAATARELGLEPDVIATDHSVPGLIAALRDHLWLQQSIHAPTAGTARTEQAS
ncbi:MAG: uroporphyrinogen-III C-methyltransferase [Chloroflexi bacterium]|nr:uroporphyrinogen-III C-methyltransferase [Chloroflexota bacterium]MDA1147270.1 uroporphyrinogen-III C-methyltransferase [Chloroflexota bacterium]